MHTLTLSSGDVLPALGLGTWKSAPGEVGAAVRAAVRLGYRHIDCAAIYGNEAEVGEALEACFAEGVVGRSDLWVTSKLWCNAHGRDEVVPALEATLANLRLDFLDLYLVHWPVAVVPEKLAPESSSDLIGLEELPLDVTWAGMEEAHERGLTRNIGVSNHSAKKLRGLLSKARVRPAVNQVELHPYLQQDELVEYCRSEEIAVTGYSPLGSGDRPERMKSEGEPVLLEDETVAEIAAQNGASPAQVLIAWQLQRGLSVIPKSVRPERLAANLAADELELMEEDMQRIEGLDLHRRYVTGKFWEWPGGPYTVANLWDD